jgi:hypothetical protein
MPQLLWRQIESGTMRNRHTSLFIIALLISTTAGAQTASSPVAATPPTTKTNEGSKVICRTEDELGSRVRKRKICMTRDEWRQVKTETGMTIEKNTTLLAKPGGG